MGDRERSRPIGRHRRFRHFSRAICFAACLSLWSLQLTGQASDRDEDIWLSVDTRELTLSVMRADVAVQVFDNIAIGSNGTTRRKQVGDEKTSLGKYRINVIRPSKRFRLFLGFDYPSMDDADRALAQGRIGPAEFRALQKAWREGQVPPQDTALGGNLGIHGLGSASLEIHHRFNWTNGCIALTNEQIDELARWVRVGTAVVIR